MNDNPYAPPIAAAGAAEEPRQPVPGYYVAFGAMALMAEALSMSFEVRWDFMIGGLAILYLLGLMMVGVFRAPVQPYSDDEPQTREIAPSEASPTPTVEPSPLFTKACLLLVVLLAAWRAVTFEDGGERFIYCILILLTASGACLGLARGGWRGMIAAGGLTDAVIELCIGLVALYSYARR